MQTTAVLNIVGLSQNILEVMPQLQAWASRGVQHRIEPLLPALTCSSQSTYLTGTLPQEHGIVGNGWYFHELAQVWLWRQSNHLVRGEKIWETARKLNPKFTCANLFWWFNMYSSVDYAVTPRPLYRADGLKLPDIYCEPASLRHQLQNQLGQFPLFQFWGPAASLRSSEWIAEASKFVFAAHRPTLNLIYLPHLDYCLQKSGPGSAEALGEIKKLDHLCAELIQFYENQNSQVIVLSEYGIVPVKRAIPINRILRQKGWLAVHEEEGEDHFDAGASQAFALADHQICHIYLKDPTKLAPLVQTELAQHPEIAEVLGREAQALRGLGHPRSGDLLAVAASDYWFSYAYWLDERQAPDYASGVEIHKKPGYDPLELFIDPKIRFPKFQIAKKLLAKRLGFRTRMNFIPFDDSLVRGSHGRSEVPDAFKPLFISQNPALTREALKNSKPPYSQNSLAPIQIKSLLLDHIFSSL